jgi:hypothetical protein
MLVYANMEYDADDSWSGLFRSQLFVYVSVISVYSFNMMVQGI